MDSADKLINAAVSGYAPSESVRKSIFRRITESARREEKEDTDIIVVYVSKDADKLLSKMFSKNRKIFRKLSKIENKIFCEVYA